MTTPPPGNPMVPNMESMPPQGNIPYPPQGGVPYPPTPPAPAEKQKNTVGRIALITAIVGFIFACIPGALIVGWVLLPVAFILGIVGLVQSGKAKGTSIGAIVVAVIGTIVGFTVFLTVVSDAVDDAFSGSDLVVSEPESGQGTAGGSSSDGSRDNPLQIGQTVTNKDWTISLGQPREASAEVSAENPFNADPKPGMEYWIVPVTATYNGDTTGSPIFEVTVKFVGVDNKTYSDSCGVIPDDINRVDELYPGGVAEANTCIAVPAGADGLWAVSTGFTGNPSFFDAS